MEKNNRHVLYVILLTILFIGLLVLLYIGAIGMNRGVSATKLSTLNGNSS